MSSEIIPFALRAGASNPCSSACTPGAPPGRSSPVDVIELASGIDALYLTGRASLPSELIERLEIVRAEAVALEGEITIDFGGENLRLAPYAWGRHRFCLIHRFGRIGLTASSSLPAIRVQPRAEFLHGQGPRGVVKWFDELLTKECGPVVFTVSRLDLFADFKGLRLAEEQRHHFVTRAVESVSYEANEEFTGLQFGKRVSGGVSARLYDKTKEIENSGSAYWFDIWQVRDESSLTVLRVEFELGREALREFGVNTPSEALDAAGSLWGYLTVQWLSLRTPTADHTRSRWPVAPEWEVVSRASIREDDWGIARMCAGKQRGQLAILMPSLVGYLSNFAALTDCVVQEELLTQLDAHLKRYQSSTQLSMEHRIWRKRREYGLE